jgi:hypothetical protein
LGDATYVRVPGVVKPINCGSKDRARLIAAAPALLEALQGLLHEDGGSLAHAASHPKCIAARAALALAGARA